MTLRLSLNDLAAALGNPSDSALAELLGITRRSVLRAKKDGLTVEKAYDWCDRVRVHVLEVWPELVEVAAGARVCAAEGCPETFVPYRPQHRFCSKRCKNKVLNPVYRDRPEAREKKRATDRRYYAECRDYLRAKQREYDARKRAERAA